MISTNRVRRLLTVCSVATALLLAASPTIAQKNKVIDRYNIIAQGTGHYGLPAGRASRLELVVYRWTTADERTDIIKTLGSDDGKAVIKLGSVHSGRGRSPMLQLDIGNATAELAVARGADSFHLLIYPRLSIDADGGETDWAEDAPYLALLDEHRTGEDWAVFDLRELRPYFAARSHREEHPDLSDIVFRFDALLLAPVFHAATETVPLP